MGRWLWIGALAACASAWAVAAPAAAPPPRVVAVDWTRTVAMTPEGGFRLGNPNARVKVVEYGSLTCPHCAQFATTGLPVLRDRYVRTGRVSFEFRNYVLNGLDMAASLLARCAGTRGFFRTADHLYATQAQWVEKTQAAGDAEWDRVQALPPTEQAARFAELGGLASYAAIGGITRQRARLCLADKAGLARLVQMAGAAEARGVSRTPTFFINGVLASGNSWPAIEPLIQRAVR